MVEVKRSSTASKFISKKNWPEPKKKFILLYNFSISYLWTTRTIAVVHLSESSTVILHFPQIIFSVVKQKGVKVSWHNKIIMGLNCSMSAGGGLSLIITLVSAVLKTWQTLRRLQNKRYRTISKLYVLCHLSRGPIKCYFDRRYSITEFHCYPIWILVQWMIDSIRLPAVSFLPITGRCLLRVILDSSLLGATCTILERTWINYNLNEWPRRLSSYDRFSIGLSTF